MVYFAGGKKASHGGGGGPRFADVVGQDDLKEALLAVAANDGLDGLLVRGEKGTAKSTAVRALADLLPPQSTVADCPYGCPPDDPRQQCTDCRERAEPPTTERRRPLVTLPLGATRERVVGTLSVADALDGSYEFEPGLLARANRGILYVDEVNLLDDHLVDVLLDAAAGGVNRVERDGVSVTHPAGFTLIGTMNPEEGDLRPQLRDRFALQVTVTACEDLDDRVAIIERHVGADDAACGDGATAPGTRLRRARDRLGADDVHLDQTRTIARFCRDCGVDGHRADIAIARTARTLAALADRDRVIDRDVREAASLAIPHRLRSRPFEDRPDPEDVLDDHFGDADVDGSEDGEAGEADENVEGGAVDSSGDGTDGDRSDGRTDRSRADETGDAPPGGAGDTDPTGSADDTDAGERSGRESGPPTDEQSPPDGPRETQAGSSTGSEGLPDEGTGERERGEPGDGDDVEDGHPAEPATIPGQRRAAVGEATAPELPIDGPPDGPGRSAGTRPTGEGTVDGDGPRVRTRRARSDADVDVAASVRAAAARGASAVESRDLRQSVRRDRAAALVVFAVDASASMRPAMRAAKGTVLELLKEAYEQRDEVAFVAFAGESAEVLLPPTDSVTLAARHLKDLPTGDRTPLPAGLTTAGEVVERADPAASVVVVVTDGRANVAEGSAVGRTREAARLAGQTASHVLVVDAGDGDRAGLAGTVAEESGGECVPLAALSARQVDAAVRTAREAQ